MKVYYKGDVLFVFDYIYKQNGTVDVLVIAPRYGKAWLNVTRADLLEVEMDADDGKNHYE